jgi:hypothetical protein
MTNAERQRLWRERKRNGVRVVTGTVTPEGVTVVAPVTPVTRVCPNCQVLADEVAALKRELAGRAEEMGARLLSPAVTRAMERFKPESDKQVTPHGPRCQGICCRGGGR